MNNSEINPHCKYCHTTNPNHFYKHNLKTCKVCRIPENRAKGISSITKTEFPTLLCKECNLNKTKDNFDISTSGFHYDKCRYCRTKHFNNSTWKIDNTTINSFSEEEKAIYDQLPKNIAPTTKSYAKILCVYYMNMSL